MQKNLAAQIFPMLTRGFAKMHARIDRYKSDNLKHCLIELAMLFGMLMAVNYLFLDGGMNEISPHPFWIPIILVSFQYGTYGGLATAIVAIVLAQIVGWGPQDAHEDHYQYFLRVWSNPALWLATAIILGEMRQGQIREQDGVNEQLRQFTKERETVFEYCRSLQSEMALLEHEIATGDIGSDDTWLDRLDEIRSLNKAGFNSELQRIINALFGPVSFNLQGIDSRGRRLPLARSNIEDAVTYAPPLISGEAGPRQPIVKQINAEALAGSARLASPLKDQRSGRMIGILEIYLQKSDKDSKRSSQIFRLLCTELEKIMSQRQQPNRSRNLPGYIRSQPDKDKPETLPRWDQKYDQNQ